MQLAILSITPHGYQLALQLKTLLAAQQVRVDCFTSDKFSAADADLQGFDGSMADCVRRLFPRYSALLFICATGITVRMIAPLVVDKLSDPAVLVMDEQAQHVISLLSGHVGGANDLTRQIAHLIGAQPVITTATDVNDKTALDTLAQRLKANIVNSRVAVKQVNQMLVENKRIGLICNEFYVEDTRGFIPLTPTEVLPSLDALVVISMAETVPLTLSPALPLIQVVPRRIVAGMGCKRNTSCEALQQMLLHALHLQQLHPLSLAAIGSAWVKHDETGLIALAELHQVPFLTFSQEQIQQHEQRFAISPWVMQSIGVGSVSQPVAWLLSDGNLIGDTLKQDGITTTLGKQQEI